MAAGCQPAAFAIAKKMSFDIVNAMKLKLIMGLMILTLLSPTVYGRENSPDATLVEAVMCEGIESFQPVNASVVFSIAQGEVFCYSRFDPVLTKTDIFHKWYKRDKLIFTMKLKLSPPKWSSFSRIQIRDADKGPWRVEIQDEKGKILETLRFSMTD